MGDLNLITVVVIGINVLISMKGFNDYSFFVHLTVVVTAKTIIKL